MKVFVKDAFEEKGQTRLTYSIDDNPTEYSISAPSLPTAQEFLNSVFPRIKARHKADTPLVRELIEIAKSGEPLDDGESQ